jgi:hypothetical protein
LRSLLTFEPQRRVQPITPGSFAGVNKRLAGLLRRVATTPESNRNNMLNKCAYLAVIELGLGNEITVRDLFTDAGRQAGLPDTEIENTLKSAGFR